MPSASFERTRFSPATFSSARAITSSATRGRHDDDAVEVGEHEIALLDPHTAALDRHADRVDVDPPERVVGS